MNYISLTKAEVANGTGVRVCLWVSGCPHHCEGCQNPESWDKNAGKEFTEETYSKIKKELSFDYCDGITFTGGDPLAPYNRDKVTEIAKRIKNDFKDKNIWCYTGYSFDEVKDLEVMKYIDFLVDGEFIKEQRDITLAFRGSRNQNIYEQNNGWACVNDMFS